MGSFLKQDVGLHVSILYKKYYSCWSLTGTCIKHSPLLGTHAQLAIRTVSVWMYVCVCMWFCSWMRCMRQFPVWHRCCCVVGCRIRLPLRLSLHWNNCRSTWQPFKWISLIALQSVQFEWFCLPDTVYPRAVMYVISTIKSIYRTRKMGEKLHCI